MAPVTVKFLRKVAEQTRGRRLAESDDPLAPWSAPTLAPYLSQSISRAAMAELSFPVHSGNAADAHLEITTNFSLLPSLLLGPLPACAV